MRSLHEEYDLGHRSSFSAIKSINDGGFHKSRAILTLSILYDTMPNATA